jgi:hypothetical protein
MEAAPLRWVLKNEVKERSVDNTEHLPAINTERQFNLGHDAESWRTGGHWQVGLEILVIEIGAQLPEFE